MFQTMTTKNNIPAGYKDSAVGAIPQEWEVKRIQEICKVDAKSLSAKTSPDYEFEYISLSDVDSDSFDISTSHQIFRTAPSRARRIVSKGDVVISTVRPNLQGFFLAKEDKKNLIASTGFAVLTPTECDSQYLLSCFFSQIVSKQFYSLVVGSNYPAVNSSDVAKIKLAVPPMDEQRKIAEILGVWDEAIERQSRLIEKLELRKRALIQRLLTGRTRLPGFTTPWQKVKFKQIFEKKNITLGANNTALEVLSVTKEGIVSQKEYFNKDIASEDTSKYLLVEKGDLAMSGLNFWMGSCHILTKYDKGIISPAYKVFKVSRIYNLPFMIHFVQSHTFKYSLVGCSVIGASIVRRNLDKEMLDEWCYLIPSLPEQKAIAEVLTMADNEIATHRKRLEALRLQKHGLMQQLLTGKTRVKI